MPQNHPMPRSLRYGGIDATDLKAHPTASSLNKGGTEPRLMGRTKGGMIRKLHRVCHNKGRPLHLDLREGQWSDFTGADGVLKDLPLAIAVIGEKV